jgi:hypothetical protein
MENYYVMLWEHTQFPVNLDYHEFDEVFHYL